MASTVRGMRVVSHKEGVEPGKYYVTSELDSGGKVEHRTISV
jgi:hypothetical protein